MTEGWIYSLTFQNRTFELAEGEQIAGRSRACDISIPDPSVSRKHVRLRPGPGHVLIQDLNSSNGTYVNDRRVQGEDAVEDGDLLRLGDAEIRVTIESPEEASTFQTMRLPTGGSAAASPGGTPGAPDRPEAAPPPPPPPEGGQRKKPGPATTMLQEESVRLAEQAERDREEVEAGKGAPQTEPPGPPETSTEEPSPLATQRLQIPPSGEAPSDAAPPTGRGPEPPTHPAPPPEEARPAAPAGGRQAPWAQPRPGEAPPGEAPPGEAQAAEQAADRPAEEDPSLRTQRIQIPEGGPPSAGPPQADSSPAATRHIQVPPRPPGEPSPPPPASQPDQTAEQEPGQAPPAGASTVRMSADELRAAGVERSAEPAKVTDFDLDEPSSPGSSEVKPPDDFVPLADRLARGEEVGSSAGPEATPPSQPRAAPPQAAPPQAAPPSEPAAAPPSSPPPGSASEPAASEAADGELSFDQPVKSWAETPPGDGREASFADLELDSSVGVEPPDEDVWEPPEISGTKATFESTWVPTEDEESGPAPPSPPPSPADAAPSPPSAAPSESTSETDATEPSAPDSPPAPPVESPAAPQAASPVPSPPAGESPAPGPEPSAPPTPPAPPAPTSFDQPTPPAAPPVTPTEEPSSASSPPPAEGSSSFDRPTAPAAPPPSREKLEAEGRAGSAGILPTLDEIDGAVAGPEMDLPYEPDPDPTASVPTIGHRSIDESAGFLLRALATVLDSLWISALTIAVWMVSDQNQLASFLVVTLCSVGNLVGWALWGTTPGKKALGLRVEDRRGTAGIGFLRAAIRAAGYVVSSLTLGIGFLMVAFRDDNRALHDRIAGTWVRRHG